MLRTLSDSAEPSLSHAASLLGWPRHRPARHEMQIKRGRRDQFAGLQKLERVAQIDDACFAGAVAAVDAQAEARQDDGAFDQADGLLGDRDLDAHGHQRGLPGRHLFVADADFQGQGAQLFGADAQVAVQAGDLIVDAEEVGHDHMQRGVGTGYDKFATLSLIDVVAEDDGSRQGHGGQTIDRA